MALGFAPSSNPFSVGTLLWMENEDKVRNSGNNFTTIRVGRDLGKAKGFRSIILVNVYVLEIIKTGFSNIFNHVFR